MSELERLRHRLGGGGGGGGGLKGGTEGLELSTAEETLYDSADVYTQTREMAAKVLREGEFRL